MTLNIVDIPEQRQVSGLSFPLTIQASIEQSGLTQTDFHSWVRDHKDHIHEQLIKHGAVLLRGFPVESAEAFEQLLDQTDYQNMPYIGGAAPRDQVTASRIVTANEAPASEKIPFHHEMAQVPTPRAIFSFTAIPHQALEAQLPSCIPLRPAKRSSPSIQSSRVK